MKTLYIFPHPDDESFGPAPVIYRQTNKGDDVYLLTLTKGGATKMRFKYDLSIKEMGEVRYKEMLEVQKVLSISEMEVLDLVDGGMGSMNPIKIEEIVKSYIDKFKPNILVTYAIHGISGHHDHLTIHAVLKRVFCELRGKKEYSFLKRLAFLTIPGPEKNAREGGNANVRTTSPDLIDCIVELNDKEISKLKEALYCYKTFIDVIESTDVINQIGNKVHFEFFDENWSPIAKDLDDGLN